MDKIFRVCAMLDDEKIRNLAMSPHVLAHGPRKFRDPPGYYRSRHQNNGRFRDVPLFALGRPEPVVIGLCSAKGLNRSRGMPSG